MGFLRITVIRLFSVVWICIESPCQIVINSFYPLFKYEPDPYLPRGSFSLHQLRYIGVTLFLLILIALFSPFSCFQNPEFCFFVPSHSDFKSGVKTKVLLQNKTTLIATVGWSHPIFPGKTLCQQQPPDVYAQLAYFLVEPVSHKKLATEKCYFPAHLNTYPYKTSSFYYTIKGNTSDYLCRNGL